MESCHLLIDKECVRDPDEPNVLRPHHQLLDPEVGPIELKPVVAPELSEVHVEGEVHELLREVTDGENIESDPDCNRGTWSQAWSRDGSCQFLINIKIFFILIKSGN